MHVQALLGVSFPYWIHIVFCHQYLAMMWLVHLLYWTGSTFGLLMSFKYQACDLKSFTALSYLTGTQDSLLQQEYLKLLQYVSIQWQRCQHLSASVSISYSRLPALLAPPGVAHRSMAACWPAPKSQHLQPNSNPSQLISTQTKRNLPRHNLRSIGLWYEDIGGYAKWGRHLHFRWTTCQKRQ